MFYDNKADYLSLLPERLREVREFSAIAKAVNRQFDALNGRIKKIAQSKAISTSDEEGILRWEKILGVFAPLNSTLQARREALTARLITKSPINMKVLKWIIETYMGLETDISVEGQTVFVRYRGVSRIADLLPLYVTIYDAIPANMMLDIAYKYLAWDELDGMKMDFDDLNAKKMDWKTFERGEWI